MNQTPEAPSPSPDSPDSGLKEEPSDRVKAVLQIAIRLMRVCYDEANRLANHCSDGAARWAMGNLYGAANEAKAGLEDSVASAGLAHTDSVFRHQNSPASVSAVPDVKEEEKWDRHEKWIKIANEALPQLLHASTLHAIPNRDYNNRAVIIEAIRTSHVLEKRAAVAESVDAPAKALEEPGAELAATHVLQNELLPCPFCGNTNPFLLLPTCRPTTAYDAAYRIYPVVRCAQCYTDVPGSNEDYKGRSAITAWNKRAAVSVSDAPKSDSGSGASSKKDSAALLNQGRTTQDKNLGLPGAV